MRRFGYCFTLLITIALAATAGFAQDGKLKIKVTPNQAYVFVDGKAIREGSHSISLSAGKHTVDVVNYGYKRNTQDVTIEAKKSTALEVKLDPYGDKVAGPYGRILIEYKPQGKAAVLLNGKKVDYFVGNVDEFNHDWWWHQELLVPPGTHDITIMRDDKEIYTGTVKIDPNQKVIIHVTNDGKMETKPWPRSEKLAKLGPLPRFKAGTASATVVVAPVKIDSFTASNPNIKCSDTSNLSWKTTDTVDTSIDNSVGVVPTTGTSGVSPKATTTYTLSAAGPGGKATSSTGVNVDTTVNANLNASTTDLHYNKRGERVLTQDSSTLTWQTSNADSVKLDGNTVPATGSQPADLAPSDTSSVPEGGQARTIDQTKTYTLTATNVCGGSSTQTATLHLTGTIGPPPAVKLQSVFYPTDYPDNKNPQVGLVRSQQLVLAALAGDFKAYLEDNPDAKLSIEAHADERGSKPFNQDLSERRVQRIKAYLVEQGISADKVQTAAYGKEQPLAKDTVKTLEASNPSTPPPARLKNVNADWLAYNRRVDIVLLPAGTKSAQYFPQAADDSGLIWQMPKPSLKSVQADQ